MLFRLHDGTAALNYQDYILEKVKDSVRASDCYIYVSDEYMSTTMSRMLNTMNLKGQTTNPPELNFLSEMIQLYQKKDYPGIKDFFEKSDSKMKDDKGMYLIYVICCKKVDVKKYQEVLEHYIAHFPDAASGYLMMIDLYHTEKDPAKGLVAIEKLDSLIGKDPFLDYYRGRCYDMQGKRAESIRCFETTYKLDPSFERNTIRLIVGYAANKENDKAKTLIGEYKKSPVFAQEDLDAVYTRFPDLK
jgi:tetratricopeptide (TPR) repeat protein